MRTGINCSSLCYAKSRHCMLVIVIIGTHNTCVLSLSTTAVNDLAMILYYDPCYTHRSSRSKEGFHQKCCYQSGSIAVATVNELDFWECAHSCPLYCFLSWTRTIKSTSNDARLALAVIQLLVSMIK